MRDLEIRGGGCPKVDRKGGGWTEEGKDGGEGDGDKEEKREIGSGRGRGR